MSVLTGFAFLAGIATILSPCILPLLPVVLSGSAGAGRLRPWGIILGFTVSFTVFTLTLSLLVSLAGITPEVLRTVSALLILSFGLVMVLPPLKNAFLSWASRLTASRAPRGVKKQGQGFLPGVAMGFSLGLVWTPCAGPIMASVVTLAATQTVNVATVTITLAYTLGTSVPLLLILLGGRQLLQKVPFLTSHSARIQQIFGGLMLLTALALFLGWDRELQTALLQAFPGYGEALTAVENSPEVLKELEALEAGK